MKKSIVPVITTLMVGGLAVCAFAQPSRLLTKVTVPIPEDGGLLVYRPASANARIAPTEWAYSLFVPEGKSEKVIFPKSLGALVMYRVEPRQRCRADSGCAEVRETRSTKTLPFSPVPKVAAKEEPPKQRQLAFAGGATGTEYLFVRVGGQAPSTDRKEARVALVTRKRKDAENLSFDIDTRKVGGQLHVANAKTVAWLPQGDDAPEVGPLGPIPMGPPGPIMPVDPSVRLPENLTVTGIENGIQTR